MFHDIIKILKLVYKFDKSKVFFFIFIAIFSTFLEGLSIGIIFPLLEIIIDDSENNYFNTLYPFSKHGSQKFFLEIIIIFLTIFIIRSIFLIYVAWWRTGYVKDLNQYFRFKIFKNYIRNEYDFFLLNKPSVIMRNTYQEVAMLIVAIDSILRIISELLVFLIILSTLIYFETEGAIIGIFLFLFFGLIYISIFKKTLKNWSKKIQLYSGKIIQLIQQSIESIKFVKISNIENKFFNLYESDLFEYAKFHRLRNFLAEFPRIYLEFLGVLVIILVTYNLYDPQQQDMSYLVPSLALMTAAAFRMLPSVGRIVNYAQSLYGISASINIIQKDLSKKFPQKKTSNKRLKLVKKIKLKNINYSYPGEKQEILKNFNLEIPKNSFVCITGESGIGKTTIIDIIAGILKPTSGKIFIDNKRLNKNNENYWKNNIGYVSQNTILFNTSIKENIAILETKTINVNKLKKAIYLSNLNKFVLSKKNGFEFQIQERGMNLSGGQIQRLGIARSLYHDPEILIFDEFTSALDKKNQNDILKSIDLLKKEKTIIAISHNKSVIRKANKIINLVKNNKGEIKIK